MNGIAIKSTLSSNTRPMIRRVCGKAMAISGKSAVAIST